MRSGLMFKMLKYLTVCSTLLFAAAMFGCSGDNGTNGTSFGTVSGTVTDTYGNKVAGATVTPTPAVDGITNVTTDANGAYTVSIPNGNFTFAFAQTGYASQSKAVTVVATQTTKADVVLTPTAAVAVNVASQKFASGSATLSANTLVFDPALKGQPITYEWKDPDGNVVGTASSVTVTQPSTAAYKKAVAQLVAPLEAIEPADATTDAEGEENQHKDIRVFKTLNRFMVVGIPMKAFEDAAITTYTVTATVGGKSFTSSPTVSLDTTALPFVPNPGLRNVPIGQPVMLQGKDQATYAWTITSPSGSAVTSLVDPATRFPHFVPDVVGNYTVTESGSGTPMSMTVYAGKWVGILKPAADDDPYGVVDAACSANGCHSASTNGKFTDWKKSGHSMIMVKGMSEGSHYTLTGCAKCHSVGYSMTNDSSAAGFKDVAAAVGFTNSTFLGNSPKFFKGFDQVLALSEVQCESCHGPNSNGDVHGLNKSNPADASAARVSFSADVCAPCHGEPKRHGRYQEWRESGHGDFEVAVGEGFSNGAIRADCAGCHTGQGFPQLLAQLQGGNPLRTLNAASLANLANVTPDTVQPITCVACHTPHNAGLQPGLEGNIVNLRGDYQSGGAWDGNTPLLPGGFQANGVGRGALCITCHNSRNGGSGSTALLHEDGAGTFNFTSYASPHEACQGDVLMGRNAYFFNSGQVGSRSKHSILGDACVTCHLQKVPADPTLGYPAGVDGAGTNHSFGIITDPNKTKGEQINALCKQCHSNFDGTGVQKSYRTAYNSLLTELSKAVLRVKGAPAGTSLIFYPARTPQVSTDGGTTKVNLSTYLASAPGTAATGAIPASGFQIDLAKANWNAVLVSADASEGVHNPGFTFDVINATIKKLKSL